MCTYKTMTQRIFKITKYIIAGGTAAVVDLSLLYILTEKFRIWYLMSAILAFIVAFIVSFLLQKFWTFRDSSTDRTHKQVIVYFIVSVFNFILNTSFVYLFTDFLHIHYIISQILASGVLAISSYFIYSLFIFKEDVFVIDNKNNS